MSNHRRITLAAAAAALAVPSAAQAAPMYEPNSGLAGPVFSETAPARVQTIDDGFDWGDAALGAGTGALVISVLAAGGLALSRRHFVGMAS